MGDLVASFNLPRIQAAILLLILEGFSNEEIAAYTDINLTKVSDNVLAIMKRLGAPTRSRLIVKCYRMKLNLREVHYHAPMLEHVLQGDN